MPNYAPGQTFDYGAAVEQGNRNALAQMQMQYKPQIYQNQLRQQQIQRMLTGLEYIKASAPGVTAETFPRYYDNLIGAGIAQPGDIPDNYAEFEKIRPALIGATDKQLAELKRKEVQSSKILDSGVVQVVYKDGTTEIKEVEQTGKDIVKRAEERGVDLQQRRAQGRGLGKDAAKVASETFKRVGFLRANNRSLRNVITEVAAGAETGPLAAKLPSMREASVRLDQIRSELGLDVVGSVSFGALSEGELKLALSTALPTKLEGPALAKWAQDKMQAQEKLAEYLEDQAIFLSEKGNTPAMWLQRQRGPQTVEQPTPQTITLPNGVVVRKIQ